MARNTRNGNVRNADRQPARHFQSVRFSRNVCAARRRRGVFFIFLIFSVAVCFFGCKKSSEKKGEENGGGTLNGQDATESATVPASGGATGGEQAGDGTEQNSAEQNTAGLPDGDAAPDTDSGFLEDELVQDEEERIAGEISRMETEYSEPQNEAAESAEELNEIEKYLNSGLESSEYAGKKDALTFAEYDKEVFVPQKVQDGYIIIHAASGNVTRSFYDELYRLKAKEYWTIPNAENAKLDQELAYEYNGDSYKTAKMTVTKENTKSVYSYREDGLITEVQNYIIYEEKNYLKSEKATSYDSENRVSQEETVDYTYDAEYKKLLETFSKKYRYFYNDQYNNNNDEDEDNDIPPDFEYYEDGVMRMKTKYSEEKGNYTSQIFFEQNFSVKTYYENYIRVKDVYMNNDRVVRVKNYD